MSGGVLLSGKNSMGRTPRPENQKIDFSEV